MYHLLRQLLFTLPPELAHDAGLSAIKTGQTLGLTRFFMPQVPDYPVQLMGLTFPNPVGLAAGMDKNADCLDGLGNLGFGFIEVGTVTPKPQPGNERPRLFRIPEKQAIINRMGFNNKGVDHLVEQVARRKYSGIVGVNIGKNLTTAVEQANEDYLTCLRKVYLAADYIAVNISSPNTPGLRSLQFGDSLKQLLSCLKSEQQTLAKRYDCYRPLALKIAPDLTDEEIKLVADAVRDQGFDGIIATNTTIDKHLVSDSKHGQEAGGLSGAPLKEESNKVISALRAELGIDFPIIGVGGIMSAEDAVQKIKSGANVVQIYSGFIYQGPALIRDCVLAIKESLAERK
ncbi:quinone-dependent dihydroorotate dehydrogenase [Zooshikella harenae]|uniref:Dihydroorotate dehydrogenase (quinone) n=1 Tax=Zooshikella harenae TaxID=2827238 RepID=A0ABS5ZFY1_9GAMM|nr:quinone-dependent dihydroorotate dehydrogenase [Zooshikella harenae]MBU2712885.1 quinone-dependent dihydroorotate dehydrogenase [Zooshikella harenae]